MAEYNPRPLEQPGSAGAGPANTPTFGSSGDSPAGGGNADTTEQLKARAASIGAKVEDRVDEGMQRAAAGLEDAAKRLHSKAGFDAPGSDDARAKAGRAAHSTADTMESVARYLRDNDTAGLQRDLERQVRDNPLQTLLVAVAAGWVVGKILR